MNALIVEDKAYIRKGLLNLLQTLNTDINVIGECESVKEAVVTANVCKPDLIFLDINLTDGNAFEFLDQIENIQFKIIFITAYEEYALQALKAGAIDYILKPIDPDELASAIQKVLALPVAEQKQQITKVRQVWDKESDTLILSLQDSFQIINLKELMFCESDKGYTTFHIANGQQYIASKSLKEFEEQLSQNDFDRPHQSYMVNLNFIDKYDKSGMIHLKNGHEIPVSSRKKDNFLKKLFDRTKK